MTRAAQSPTPVLVTASRPGTKAPLLGASAVTSTLVPQGGLWSHQAAAVEAARAGRHTVLAVAAESGRSLPYEICVMEASAEGRTSLVVCSSLAAARRTSARLQAAGIPTGHCRPHTATRQPDDSRRTVYVTTPEGLHTAILPNHRSAGTFLSRLAFVVVDDLERYSGSFGDHMGHVLRRLRRLCSAVGAFPTLVATSGPALLPSRSASRLWGLGTEQITADTSRREAQTIAVAGRRPGASPPRTDGGTAPATAHLMAAFLEEGRRVASFSRTRKGAETVATLVRTKCPPGIASAVEPYRGGYLPWEKSWLDRQIAAGAVRGISATTGSADAIDLSDFDVCLLDGYPGGVSDFWRLAASTPLVVLVAGADALDQWVADHPDHLLLPSTDRVPLGHTNPRTARQQLLCAAWDSPLSQADASFWADGSCMSGPGLEETLSSLVDEGLLGRRDGLLIGAGHRLPYRRVRLRGGSLDDVRIVTSDGELLGTVQARPAAATLHEGAVYLHRGRRWRSVRLDIDSGVGLVEPCHDEETTVPRTVNRVRVGRVTALRLLKASGATRVWCGTGDIVVSSRVVGYRRRHAISGELLGDVPLGADVLANAAPGDNAAPGEGASRSGAARSGTPGVEAPDLPTTAMWYRLGAERAESLSRGALHAVEHLVSVTLALHAGCHRSEIGGFWLSEREADEAGLEPLGTGPAVLVHDVEEGGSGAAETGYRLAGAVLEAAGPLVESCSCRSGCPGCVHSPHCGAGNEPLDKAGAAAYLALLRSVGAEDGSVRPPTGALP